MASRRHRRDRDKGSGHRGGAWRPFAGPVLVAVAANLLLNLLLPGWAYVPAFAVAAVAALALARRAGASAEDLGLAPGEVRRSALIGLAAGSAAAALIFLGLAVRALRDLYADQRAAGLGAGALAYQALVRIPLGTALGEELIFRGALLGVGLRTVSKLWAVGISSALFGLWHILPTLSVRPGNASLAGRTAVLVVTGAVASTALAGAGFAWLRLRTRHVAGAIVLHALMNASSLIAAYLVAD